MKIAKKDYVALLAKEAGLSQVKMKEVLEAMEVVNTEVLLSGLTFDIPGVGAVKIKEVKARAEKTMMSGLKGTEVTIPAQEEHNKITVAIKKQTKEAIKEATLGNLFEK